MKRLNRLCEAVRAVSPLAELRFLGVSDREDFWVVRVAIRDVILVETSAGPLEVVMVDATKKMQSFSQRILLAAVANGDEDPSKSSTLPPPPPTRPVKK